MESINQYIIEIFFSVTPNIRIVLITLFAFGEGLPIVGSFLPGGTIALLVGGLSKESFINPWLAVNLIALGSLAGDLIGFFVGMKLGNVKVIKKILESEKHVKKWDLFDRHAALVIIFGKILPVIRSTPALFAGARRMNIGKYIFYVLIGSYLWAAAGIFGGKYIAEILGDSAVVIIIAAGILIGLITFIVNKTKKDTNKKTLS